MTQEQTPREDTDQDPFHELRESLEGMGKKELTKARSDAIKDLVEAVGSHSLAQEVAGQHEYSSSPPREVTLPGAGVTIRAEALDWGPYATVPKHTVTLTGLTAVDPTAQSTELVTDKHILGDDCSLRDMQAVVQDVVGIRTMQERLATVGPASAS